MVPVSREDVLAFVAGRVLGDAPRRNEARKWVEYYQGNQAKHIPKNRDESDSHFAGRPKCTLNITRRVIDTKSCLYNEGCVRETQDPDVKRFWAEVDIDQRMREADPLTRLCGTFFVFPDFMVPARSFWGQLKSWFFARSDGANPAQDGRFVWRAYPAHLVEVMLDPDFPEIPQALAIFHTARGIDLVDHTFTQVWTSKGYWRFTDAAQTLEEEHDFGRIPFVVFRNEPDWTADFWGRAEAPNVVPQNEEVNRLVSSLQWLVISQSHGQWLAKNAPAGWKPVLGTDQIVVIQDDPNNPSAKAELTLIAPVANAEGLKNTIDWNLDKICEVNDIPAGTYRLDQNRQSGSSLSEKRVATYEYRKRRRPQALAWERELAALARIVKAGRTGQPIPAGVPEIRVDYREPESPQAVQDRVTREQHELQTGQATPPELLMRHNPDLTWDQAVKEHEFNQGYNQDHAAQGVEAALPGESGQPNPEARAEAEAAIAAAAAGVPSESTGTPATRRGPRTGAAEEAA
jgi:hypothetical protein